MARYIMEVVSRALPGRDADYVDWYVSTHIGEVCELDEIESGKLQSRIGADGKATGEYVAHYVVETADPAALLQTLFAAAATMKMTDAIDMENVRFSFLEQLGA